MKAIDDLKSSVLKRILLRKANAGIANTAEALSDISPELIGLGADIAKIHVRELNKVNFTMAASGLALLVRSFDKYDSAKTKSQTATVIQSLIDPKGSLVATVGEHDKHHRELIIDAFELVKKFKEEMQGDEPKEPYVPKGAGVVGEVNVTGEVDYSDEFIEDENVKPRIFYTRTDDSVKPVVFFVDDVEICRLQIKMNMIDQEAILAIADDFPILRDALLKNEIVAITTDAKTYVCLFTKKMSGLSEIEAIMSKMGL